MGLDALDQFAPDVDKVQYQINVVNIDMHLSEKPAMTRKDFENYQSMINTKGMSKDWTQRELSFNAMKDCFEAVPQEFLDKDEEFLGDCTVLLKWGLEDNNI